MRKLVIVSDAWEPQVNGVVRTLQTTIKHLDNIEVEVIHPGLFRNFALPKYSEIRVALPLGVGKKIAAAKADHIHIATEGPLGWAAMLWCRWNRRDFSTSYHTQFPQYLRKIYGIPESLTYSVLRWFHSKATSVMVNSVSMMDELKSKGFKNLKMWSRGVDTQVFRPDGPTYGRIDALRGPIALNVGRVSAEKNLEAFYEEFLFSPFQKWTVVQVGDGPMLEEYKHRYPNVHFIGALHGKELAQAYRSADVFVFPSRSDTFGLVMLEAMASGVPVVGYTVTGPVDVVAQDVSGCLGPDLALQAEDALKLDRQDVIDHARTFSWRRCTDQFVKNLV